MPLTYWVVLFMGSPAGALGTALKTFLPDACFDLGLVAWEVRGRPLSSLPWASIQALERWETMWGLSVLAMAIHFVPFSARASFRGRDSVESCRQKN